MTVSAPEVAPAAAAIAATSVVAYGAYQAGVWASQDNGPNYPLPQQNAPGGIQPTYPLPGTNTLISTIDPLGSAPSTTTLPQPGTSIPASLPLVSVATSNTASVLLARREYRPRGLSKDQEAIYHDVIETLKKDVWHKPANWNTPKEIIDEIGDLIKQDLSAQDVINQAPFPDDEEDQ